MGGDQESDLGGLAEGTVTEGMIAGRYRLVRPLGQGGMGRVWLARDEVLHRYVAIKELVLPPGLSSDHQQEMRERSIREARSIARLNHTNVVRIFDVLHTDGEPRIVMEFVPSRSLQQVLAQDGPLAPAEAARIGLAVLAALRAAHRAGLLHRDVKPANVLLAEDGRVVLTDFGLAMAPDDPSMTQTGAIVGSPSYLAPERAIDGAVGPAADLWSLGATLYTAVEGQPPYSRPSTLATLAALVTGPPAPAAHAGALAPALEGLLHRDPSQRVGAEEAERLLRQAAAGQPSPSVSAAPATLEIPTPRSPEPQPPAPLKPQPQDPPRPQPLDQTRPQPSALSEPQPLASPGSAAGPPTGAEPQARRGRRVVLIAAVVAVALLAGGLTAYWLGHRSTGREPVQNSGIGLVVPPVSSESDSGAVPSPSVSPSRPASPSPTKHPAGPTSTGGGSPSPVSTLQPIIPATGVISHGGAWCADIANSIVRLWDCNHSPPQTWTVQPDGRLSALGGTMCMMPVNDARAVGTAVGVGACSPADSAQIWRQQTNSTIVNIASGLCMSPGTFGYTDPFALRTCTADSLQQWIMPPPG